jgi:hypothetical protein
MNCDAVISFHAVRTREHEREPIRSTLAVKIGDARQNIDANQLSAAARFT